MKRCDYCGEPCRGYATATTIADGKVSETVYFHHGDDPWVGVGEPSCYEKAQWEAGGGQTLLDYVLGLGGRGG